MAFLVSENDSDNRDTHHWAYSEIDNILSTLQATKVQQPNQAGGDRKKSAMLK
jgi:hypothetical protein